MVLVNELLSYLQRPEKGWDPISKHYAEAYAQREWRHVDETLIDRLEAWLGGFPGKRVLDLGGGPGHFSVAFAKRGAEVIWHDVSLNYLEIAKRHAASHGVRVGFSLGYMEEARKFRATPFDLVFNRVCWYYCMNDARFARLLYSLLKPGGVAYVETNVFTGYPRSPVRKIQQWLNNVVGYKIGHPFPPRGRVSKLFRRFPVEVLLDESSDLGYDFVAVRKVI